MPSLSQFIHLEVIQPPGPMVPPHKHFVQKPLISAIIRTQCKPFLHHGFKHAYTLRVRLT
ncbi:hypothetical protein LguiA_007498 [Lonicera macranthoides]